jgi:hypothetical protein
MSLPIVYIASPYRSGDLAVNTRFQMQIWDQLLDERLVIPFAPLWNHFQHLVFPRHYQDWLNYDKALIKAGVFNACLRLDTIFPQLDYLQTESSGAHGEEALFRVLGLPVFKTIYDLYDWARGDWRQ